MDFTPLRNIIASAFGYVTAWFNLTTHDICNVLLTKNPETMDIIQQLVGIISGIAAAILTIMTIVIQGDKFIQNIKKRRKNKGD